MTISIIGMLAFNVGALSSTAIAGPEEDLRASLSELLFKAVTSNDLNAVRTVVEAGADLARVNLNGKTAMDIAVDRSHFNIAQYLVFARRIEQQTAIRTTPPVADIRQTSPEAVPVVKVAVAPASKNPVIPAKPQVAPKPEATAKVKEPTFSELMNTAKKLAAVAEALANKSAPEPVVSSSALAKNEVAPEPEPELAVIPSAPVFIIGPNGQLLKATPDQIKQAQLASQNQQAQKVASLEPAVEPRKSIFIPKPRHKPSSPPRQQTATVKFKSVQPALPTSKIPKTSTPRIEVPPFAKPSIPRISEGSAPETVRIRPTRRISPQLLEKLRRRLRTTNKRKDSVSEVIAPVGPDAPEVKAPALPRAVSIEPLPPVKKVLEQTSTVAPIKSPQPAAKVEPAKDAGAVESIVKRLGNLFGFENSQPINKPKEQPKAKTTSKPKLKLEIAAAKLKKQIAELDIAAPPVKALPQNTPNGFETRKAAPVAKPKAKPVEVAIATPAATVSPRIELPARKPAAPKPFAIPVPKTAAPGVLSGIKELLLPSASRQAKIDTSISETATDKAIDSSLRRVTRQMPLSRLRKPLKNVLLTLGDSVTTGQTKLPRGMAEPDACVRKRRGKIFFCIVPVDWPRVIEPAFSINTSLYQGTRAIARYDNGKTSHFHALYDAVDHQKIVNFLKKRYGPPTDIWKRMIAPFGEPRRPNPTYVWRSLDSETDKVTILEIRKYDDSRSVFPDTEHGAIRLYAAGGPPVFPIITAHDIMSIDWAARSDHIDGASPALARTIRVEP
ncbi:MAG: hypothetical protein HON14_16440 [Rhodospirillaceae bacterium]|nr:hypothetical protein [Rhodospirillaceae bacterium]